NKDVTADLIEFRIHREAANPNVVVDTCYLVLADPTGRYVTGRVESDLYPNVRLHKECRVVVTLDGLTRCLFYGTIEEAKPIFPKKQDKDRRQRIEFRLESPLRRFVKSKAKLTGAPSGVLVGPDGVSGVVPALLALVDDIIPANTWLLDPTADIIDPGFLAAGMTVQQALQQCALFSDSIYGIIPLYRVQSDRPEFYFFWQYRDAKVGTIADHTWIDTDRDISAFEPLRFTEDDL
ncbi:MAG: hypothetical protein ACREMY_09930, partial [bacterium]